MKCKHCGSENVTKNGISYSGGRKQRLLCKDCGRHFYSKLKDAEAKR